MTDLQILLEMRVYLSLVLFVCDIREGDCNLLYAMQALILQEFLKFEKNALSDG
jgi:hypothetical protein